MAASRTSPDRYRRRPSMRSMRATHTSSCPTGTGLTKVTVSVAVTAIFRLALAQAPSSSSIRAAIQPPWAT